MNYSPKKVRDDSWYTTPRASGIVIPPETYERKTELRAPAKNLTLACA